MSDLDELGRRRRAGGADWSGTRGGGGGGGSGARRDGRAAHGEALDERRGALDGERARGAPHAPNSRHAKS